MLLYNLYSLHFFPSAKSPALVFTSIIFAVSLP
jgi:hypothetical protein